MIKRAGRSPRRSPCRSEEHTSELQSHSDLVCRLLLEKKKYSARKGSRPAARNAHHTSATCQRIRFSHPPQCKHRPEARCLFFFNDASTTEIYTLSLHDALPI